MTDTVLYHSFNARYLSLEEVANFFIPNVQFNDLLRPNHTLLLGPRGCGKTTLLKMLTPKAINHWNSINQDKIELPFFAVYIPADNQWKKELDNLKKELHFSTDFALKISEAIVCLNVIKSITQTINDILEIVNAGDKDFHLRKRNLCADLINIFELDKPISPDFYSIEFAIRQRLKKINSHVEQIKLTKNVNFGDLPAFYFFKFFDLAASAIFVFEKNFKDSFSFKNTNFRWALCFDELELAPDWLQDVLLNQLRSRSEQNILFKLTSTPIINTINTGSNLLASEKNDYDIIRAWTYDSEGFRNWEDFSHLLAASKIKNALKINKSPNELFGAFNWKKIVNEMELYSKDTKIGSADDEEDSSWKGHFAKGKSMWYLTKFLAIHDSAFRLFLEKNNISIHNPEPKSMDQMAPIYRKMVPIIIFRSQFIRDDKNLGRKNAPLYFGTQLIYDICDGNPRLLTGLLDELLKEVISGHDYSKPNKINWQSRIIYRESETYLKLITAHPDANIIEPKGIINLASIIKEIGNYFNNTLRKDPFTINPYGSFVVDQNIKPQIVSLIELGVKYGAFVYLNPKDVVANDGITNKIFRLSYILHPTFKLPIREYKEEKLSNILYKRNSSALNNDLFSDNYEAIIK